MRRIGVLAVASLLVGVSCGSDDDESPSATDVMPTTTEDMPTTTEAPSPTTTEAPPADPPMEDDAVGPIPTGDADSTWCTRATKVEMALNDLDVIDFTDPDVLESTYRRARILMDDARGEAPPELADAVDTSIEGVDIIIDGLEQVNWNFVDLDLSAIADIDADLQESGRTIDRYNFYVCDIDNDYDPDEIFAAAVDDAIDSLREQTIEELVTQGFTLTEAECLYENIDRLTAVTDNEELLALYLECGIDNERLVEIGASAG
ncbi:MAG: hypothetical protein HKN44_02990 [Ilumatobacter sp.]|nr:hypothetical protein [Ilumatobacter sp.]